MNDLFQGSDECPHCSRARAGVWHGFYDLRCDECRARYVARTLAAWHALHPAGSGDKTALRELIERALPSMPLKAAREAVWKWWQHDHQPAGALT